MPNRNLVGDYRYNYQGQELDQETGKVAFELRLYDPRINRWLTPDPKNQYHSPYMSMGNNWISRVDPDGGDDNDIFYNSETGESTEVVTNDNFDRVFIDGEFSGKFSKGAFDLGFLNITNSITDFSNFSSSQIPYVDFDGRTIGAFGLNVTSRTEQSRRGNTLFGVEAQGGFIDLGSGLDNLKFFQTITSNDGRGQYPRIDGHPESYPFYLDTPELGFDLGYFDFPNRPDTGQNIQWRAEFSMLNVHNDGTIQRIFTYGYGFQVSPSQNNFGQLGRHGFIQNPSSFHLNSINGL